MKIAKRIRAILLFGFVVPFQTSLAQSITVIEYYNRTLDAFFITGRSSEQAALDKVADFSRTGMTFQAASTVSGIGEFVKICRFYISLPNPYTSSHFYGRQTVDCEPLRALNISGFSWEDYDFAIASPAAGCPFPIYRGFRAAAFGKTSNHRYSVGQPDYVAAQVRGFAGEDVVFCANSATPTSSPLPTIP